IETAMTSLWEFPSPNELARQQTGRARGGAAKGRRTPRRQGLRTRRGRPVLSYCVTPTEAVGSRYLRSFRGRRLGEHAPWRMKGERRRREGFGGMVRVSRVVVPRTAKRGGKPVGMQAGSNANERTKDRPSFSRAEVVRDDEAAS